MHSQDTRDRLLGRLNKLDNGCWEYNGCCHIHNGYGTLRVNGKQYKAHRLMWEITNGPIPNDLRVLHTCDNPPCCNPEHLFLGTQQDNVADMIAKGRSNYSMQGNKNGRSVVQVEDIPIIRKLCDDGFKHTEIAELYGVQSSAISKIATGKTWSHI